MPPVSKRRHAGPMTASLERQGIPGVPPGGMEAITARSPTSSALTFPSIRGALATPLPRSARRLALRAAICLAALAGCEPYVQGNGVYFQEQRPDPGPFTGVHVESGVEVGVEAGAAARRVVVSGDSNVVPYIETEVRTDAGRQVLHVRISRAFAGTIPPRAAIEVPVLEYAFATDHSKIGARKLAAASFQVSAEGGSSVSLEGLAAPAGASIDVQLATRAHLDASGYVVSSGASVELTGASIAKLHSDGPVSGTVSGGSELDNLQGTGGCSAVVADGSSTVRCAP